MRYTGFRVGVVYIDRWWVENWFKEFAEKNRDSISKYIVNYSDIAIVLKDGTTIRAIKANESSRGHRLDKVFVQYGVSVDEVNEYIRPLLMPRTIWE